MELLPILTWEEVWNDIGRKYPEYAGTAYLMVGGRKDAFARSAVRFAIQGKNQPSKWDKIHRHLRFPQLVVGKAGCHRDAIANREHAKRVIAELLSEFQDDKKALIVIRLLLEGLSQSEIAEQVGVSRQAINEQVKKIRQSERLQEMARQ